MLCEVRLLFDDNDIVGAVKKCFWIFALVAMTGGMLNTVYGLTKTYLSYPVSVSVSVEREKQIVFPAVTVCNMSPVKKSVFDAHLSGASKRRKKRVAAGLYTLTCAIYIRLFVTNQNRAKIQIDRQTVRHTDKTPQLIPQHHNNVHNIQQELSSS